MTAPSFAATGRIPTDYQCLTTFFQITGVLIIFRDFPLAGEADAIGMNEATEAFAVRTPA